MSPYIDTVDYTRAIRQSPDASVQSAPSPAVGFLSELLVKLLLPPAMLLQSPFLILVKLLKRRNAPKWSVLRFLGISAMRLNTVLLTPWMPRPRSEEEQWGLPAEGKPYRDAITSGELDFEVVKLDPIAPELRKGIADVKGVETTSTPGFWVRPNGVRKDKVILYIHGG